MDEYNCFVFFVKTELLFDIEIGSVVFKVYGISDFQNYMVRYSGIVKRYGLTTMQMMMLDSDDSESDKEDDFRRNGRIFLRTCFRSCGAIDGRSHCLVLSGQRHLQLQGSATGTGDWQHDRVDDSYDQTTTTSNCG